MKVIELERLVKTGIHKAINEYFKNIFNCSSKSELDEISSNYDEFIKLFISYKVSFPNLNHEDGNIASHLLQLLSSGHCRCCIYTKKTIRISDPVYEAKKGFVEILSEEKTISEPYVEVAKYISKCCMCGRKYETSVELYDGRGDIIWKQII